MFRGAVLPDGTVLTYREYIESEAWQAKKAQYRRSRLPQKCVVCGDRRFDLHHMTYRRLGHERLWELVPLCREHHDQIKVIQRNQPGMSLWAATKYLVRKVYGRDLKGRVQPKRRGLKPRLYLLRKQVVRRTMHRVEFEE